MPDYTDLLGSVDPAMLSQLHALSLKQAGDMPAYSSMADTHLHMPTSPMVGPNTVFGLDHSMAKAIMSSRASAFPKRSQSFIHRAGHALAHVAAGHHASGTDAMAIARYPVSSMYCASGPHPSGAQSASAV